MDQWVPTTTPTSAVTGTSTCSCSTALVTVRDGLDDPLTRLLDERVNHVDSVHFFLPLSIDFKRTTTSHLMYAAHAGVNSPAHRGEQWRFLRALLALAATHSFDWWS